jgi:hypothetical protein
MAYRVSYATTWGRYIARTGTEQLCKRWLQDRAKTPILAARLLGPGSSLALWVTIDSTAVVTANSSATLIPANTPEYFGCSPGQVLNFISASTSTGYVVVKR